MATVTCTTPGCGASLAPGDFVCPACGSGRAVGADLGDERDGHMTDDSSGDGSQLSNPDPDAQPVVATCDHQAREPGAITCPTCGAPADGELQQRRPPERPFRLGSPWGEWVVVESVLEIGREVGPLADHLRCHMTVSRRHASLRVTPSGRLHVIDHNSTNGTFRNDRRIDAEVPVELQAGDTVSFSSAVRFDVDDEPDEPREQ